MSAASSSLITTVPALRRLLTVGIVAALAVAVVEVVLVLGVRATGTAVVAPLGGGEPVDLPLAAIVATDLVAGVAGALGAALLARRVRRPARTVAITGTVLTLLSLVPVLAGGLPASSALVLAVMHLLTGTVVVGALVRSLPGEVAPGGR